MAAVSMSPTPPMPEPAELEIATLGPSRRVSPVGSRNAPFVDETNRILLPSKTAEIEPYIESGAAVPSFEPAGPRREIFFDPGELTCGILTCGGLCPGLNNVIRSIVLQLYYSYGVKRILGFRYGYAGLSSTHGHEPFELGPDAVAHLHERGGTLLASSRGKQDVGDMVDNLVKRNVGILFVIGGDGGLSGALEISREIERRGLDIGIVGVPKTIDNDLLWTWRTFGFATAVKAASEVILAAHAEALGAWNGVGLVKLMGRHSGFIAAHATLACSDVNFCLVPEVPFRLEGQGGFLAALRDRLEKKRHAVVVVAEGAGQELFTNEEAGGAKFDPSGNVVLQDIGVYLRDRIVQDFADRKIETTVKYIDPSYTIRSLPANSFDAQLCLVLGQYAVHAAMAGRTRMVVGVWNHHFTHIPLELAVSGSKQIDPDDEAWQRVIESTGQPAWMSVSGS